MAPCTRYEDDLALLAGGDLEPRGRVDEVLGHVAACAHCRRLLADLQADQDVFAGVTAVMAARAASMAADLPPVERGLSAAVLRRVEALEAFGPVVEAAPPSVGRAGRARHRRLAYVGLAAAAVAVAFAWPLLAPHLPRRATPDTLPVAAAGQAATPEASPAVAAATTPPDTSRPIWVRKAQGAAVELVWAGDGREDAPAGAEPYKVLASASPRDFTAARPVQVAGNRLVATMALPELRAADRKVTYFQVQ